jgi:hypothetical protein
MKVMYRSGRSHIEMSEMLGRSRIAIKSRLRELGLM